MSKGLPRSLAHASPAVGAIRKSTFPIKAIALSVAGAAGIGFGSVVIGDFPEGNVLLHGAVGYVKLSTVDIDVITAFSGNYSVGSSPTTDNTLSGSEIDILPSAAINAAVSGVSALTRNVNATAVLLDNTDGSLELNLNVLIADASISGIGDFIVNGFVTVLYTMMGDD